LVSVAARRPIVLAGGLNPDNVADAIECVRPFAIDVSSGVEAAPGVKDHGRLKRLFDSVRQADSLQRTPWTQR
jgi:phosphoribosylanthranilate isomerase